MNEFITALIGLVVGFSSGLFGIGGSIIATPLLRIAVGLAPLFALASPFPAVLPSAVSGSIVYARKRLIDKRVALITLVAGYPSVILGSYCSNMIDGNVLMILTGCVLALVGITFLVRSWLLHEPEIEYAPLAGRIIIIAAFAGFLAGLLAIGGGIVFVPAYVRLLRMHLKQAIATSLFCVGCFAIPGTIVHATLGHIDWLVSGILAITMIPASNLGARFGMRLHTQLLQRIYGIALLAFAIWFVAIH